MIKGSDPISSCGAVHYQTITVQSTEDVAPEAGVTADYSEWLQRLVLSNLAFSMCAGNLVCRFMVARRQTTLPPFAFCYYYVNVDTDHCELFAVYVDGSERGLGIAEALLMQAIAECVQNHCGTFALRFIDPSARTSHLCTRLRESMPHRFPGTRFFLYYEDEPRCETIGS